MELVSFCAATLATSLAPNLPRFLNNLPLVHFLKARNIFASPTPLLLASVLYISALHQGSTELASMESGYFVSTCSAVAELVMPCSKLGSEIRVPDID